MDINSAYKSFIEIMWNNILKSYQSLFKLEPKVVTFNDMVNTVHKVFPGIAINLYDEKYAVIRWSSWQDIIFYDWTRKKKYVADTFDCDNFSGSFCARAAEIFNLNTAGRFTCVVTTATGELLPHRAVLIIALDEADNLSCYVYESQNEGWQKVVSPTQTIKIGSWKYQGNLCEFN